MDLKAELKSLLAKHDKAAPKKSGSGHEPCCPELAAELIRNRDALVEALCANCCMCHICNCCPIE